MEDHCKKCKSELRVIEVNKTCLEYLGNDTSKFRIGELISALVTICKCSGREALLEIVNGTFLCKAFEKRSDNCDVEFMYRDK